MKVKVMKAFKDRSSESGPYKLVLPGEVVSGRTAEYAIANGCGEEFIQEANASEVETKVFPEQLLLNKALDGQKTKKR